MDKQINDHFNTKEHVQKTYGGPSVPFCLCEPFVPSVLLLLFIFCLFSHWMFSPAHPPFPHAGSLHPNNIEMKYIVTIYKVSKDMHFLPLFLIYKYYH